MVKPYLAPFSVDLTGHAALVTGAGAEIGRAAAIALAQSGAAVLVNDINPDKADETADFIVAGGGRALPWQADVSNRFQVGSMIEAARDAFNRVDILVNAAGVYKRGPFDQVDEWDWRRALDVNLTGAFFCMQLLGRVMAEEGGGAIVNIGSVLATASNGLDGVAYIASKAGIIGLTTQSAAELASRGIRVNAIAAPPDVDDALAASIAAIVLFLCSDAARAINGQLITASRL